jgi:hypothetical protein
MQFCEETADFSVVPGTLSHCIGPTRESSNSDEFVAPLQALHLSLRLIEFQSRVSRLLQNFEASVVRQVEIVLSEAAFALAGSFIVLHRQGGLLSLLPIEAYRSTERGSGIVDQNHVVFSDGHVAKRYHFLV